MMADSAIFCGMKVFFSFDFEPHFTLRFDGVGAFRHPTKIGDVLMRTESVFWMAVAFKAKPHGQALVLVNHFHMVYASVATHAGNSGFQMARMVKINIVG